MVLWILFIILILILGLFIFFRFRNNHSQNLLRDSTVLIARQKLEELNHHGKEIRRLQQAQYVPVNSIIPSLKTKVKESDHPHSDQISNQFSDLRENILNILVGKYHLDPETQDYISRQLNGMFERETFEGSKKGSLQNRIRSVKAKYDPTYSNDLLLHSSRFLMNYENLSPSIRLLVAQFIVNTTLDGEELDRIYDWIIELGSDTTASQQVRQEAVDMLILSNSSRYRKIADQILESIRRIDDIPQVQAEPEDNFPFNVPAQLEIPIPARERRERPRTIRLGGVDYDITTQRNLLHQFQRAKPKVERTVYQDGQSVHNTEINKSVLQAAKSLQAQYPMKTRLSFDTSLLKDLSPEQRRKAEASLHRIATDDATFGENITLSNLFQSLQSFILSSSDKDELNKRLIQELGDMSGTCASGHLSRLVNVVQGFNAVPQQAIRINLGDEIYATASHALTQALAKPENQEISEAVIMGENQKLVNNFVARELTSLLPKMQKEYQGTAKDGEILRELLSAAKKYTKDEHFTVQQNEIVAR